MMQISPVDERRNVLPRWRSFDLTRRSGLLVPETQTGSGIIEPDQEWESVADSWRASASIPNAMEVVAAAVVLGKEDEAEAQEAAAQVLSSGVARLPGIATVAERILGRIQVDEREANLQREATLAGDVDHQKRVHELRERLHAEPRNPILWVELSREYTILAVDQKAIQAMEIALQLADDNRFVVRSAARLFVHLDEPERAHDILRRTHSVGFDPWILASEIAIASVADRRSQLVKKGQQMLSENDWSPFSTNELASSLATLELSEGGLRSSRRLFRASLQEPNDNSLAQAEWASQRLTGVSVEESQLATPWSFEARARAKYRLADFRGAVEECREWYLDEPFSSQPAGSAAFILAVALGDFDESAQWARRGLAANPNDQTLRNNLVFALASAGHLTAAKEELAQASPSSASASTRAALKATEGLILYREGQWREARKRYLEALEEGKSFSDEFRLLATAFMAREELRRGGEEGLKLLRDLRDSAGSLDHAERYPYLGQLMSLVRTYLPKPST